MIQHQITNEHYSPHFCSPLLLTSDQHIRQHSHHTTSNHKRTLLMTLLFTSFAHFRSTYSTTLTSYNIKSQTNTTENTSVHLFCSLPINIFDNTHIIEYHVTVGYREQVLLLCCTTVMEVAFITVSFVVLTGEHWRK